MQNSGPLCICCLSAIGVRNVIYTVVKYDQQQNNPGFPILKTEGMSTWLGFFEAWWALIDYIRSQKLEVQLFQTLL